MCTFHPGSHSDPSTVAAPPPVTWAPFPGRPTVPQPSRLPQPADTRPESNRHDSEWSDSVFPVELLWRFEEKGQRLFTHWEIKAFSFLPLPKLVSTSNQEYLQVDQKAVRKKAFFSFFKKTRRKIPLNRKLFPNVRQHETGGGWWDCDLRSFPAPTCRRLAETGQGWGPGTEARVESAKPSAGHSSDSS